jgi:photosystem II stability/assembly factor-like uncharacterized protein
MKISFSNWKIAGFIILCEVSFCITGNSQTLDPGDFSIGKLNPLKSIPSKNKAVEFFPKHNIQTQSTDVWEQTGPNGITANCITVDPNNSNIIFAGCISGLYKTTNGGINWALAGTETLNKYFLAVAVSPDSPSIVFSQTNNEFMKSTDGGNSWSNILHKFTTYNLVPHAIYMNANKPGRVLMYSDSIYTSTDGGNNWRTDSTFGSIRILSVYGQNQDIIYAIGASSGSYTLFKSIDWGSHWTVVNGNTTNVLVQNNIETMQVSSNDPNVIFAGRAYLTDHDNGFFRSTDGGLNWVRSDSGFGQSKSVAAIANDPANPNGVYAGGYANGLYHSTDLGISWNLASGEIQDYYIDGLSAAVNGNIYCCFGGSIYSVSNGGTSWKSLNGDLKIVDVFSVVIDPSNDNILYACSLGGVYKSVDGGATWQQRNNGIIDTDIKSLAIDPQNSSVLYTGTYGGLIFKSTNAGDSWVEKSNGFPASGNYYMWNIHVSQKNSDWIWTSGAPSYQSKDAGENWSSYVIGGGHSVIESLYCLNQPDTLYAITGIAADSLFRSTDGGLNWNFREANEDLSLLTVDKNASNVLYAYLSSGMIKSNDGGVTWNRIYSDSLNFDRNIYLNTGNSSYIYVSTENSGIIHSTDGGQNWNYYNNGLPYTDVFCVTSSNSHPYKLFASVRSGGIYKVNQTVTSVNSQSSKYYSFSLGQNYPNPFNPSTIINYSIPKSGLVSIKIYDLLGKEIKTLVSEEKSAGNYSVQFNGSNLSSGIYFYRMQSGNHMQTKKLILLK